MEAANSSQPTSAALEPVRPHTSSRNSGDAVRVTIDKDEGGEMGEEAKAAPRESDSELVRWVFGLRGLAAVLVLCHHLADFVHGGRVKNMERPVYWMPFEILIRGVSVGVFFVLSGFSLSLRYYRHLGSDKALKALSSGALRRPLRLFVPVFVAGLVSYLMYEVGGYGPGTAVFERKRATLDDAERDWFTRALAPLALDPLPAGERVLFFLRDMVYRVWSPEYHSPLNGTFWTIAVEMQGSVFLFLALLVVAYMRDLPRRTLLAGVALGGVFANDRVVLYLLQFLAGALFADLYLRPLHVFDHTRTWQRVLSWTLKWTLFALAYYLISVSDQRPMADTRYAWLTRLFERFLAHETCHYIGSILIVYSIQINPYLARALGARAMVCLGRLSFGLYLLHYVFLYSFVSWVYLHMENLAPWAAYFGLLPLLFLATGTAAYLFARGVDEPFSRALRKFEKIVTR